MKTIKLYGELGKKYGRVHRLDVRTPGEAIKALCANHKQFRKDLETSHLRGVGYRVKNGLCEIGNVDQIKEPASRTIQIIPAVIGAGTATDRILLGVVIIAAVILSGGTGAPGAAGYFASVGIGVGTSLVLGGVAQLLSPPPEKQDIPERPENTPNYNFNGPVNTTAQGHPVPVGYGRLIVGGAVISAGINLEQQKTGFKRIKSTTSVDINVNVGTDTKHGAFGASVPANWYAKTRIGGGADFTGSYDTNRYYYYVWTLEPL